MLVILFLTIPGVNNPLFRGREILGETSTIFWLIAGYTFLWITLGKSNWYLLLTMIAWGVAINSKAQVLPFWIASLLATMAVALIKRWWRGSLLIFLAGSGSWLFSRMILNIQRWILTGITVSRDEPLRNYYAFTAMVLDWSVRERALIIVFVFGFLSLLGILYVVWQQLRRLKQDDLVCQDELIRVAILGLTVSWMAWYLLFSNAWFRYYYPPIFFGSIYASALLFDITGGFSWSATFKKYKQKTLSMKTMLLPLIALWLLYLSFLTVTNFVSAFSNNQENYLDVATYIDQSIDKDALIETYETDIIFLLSEHRFHHPPDQVHVDAELNTLYNNPEPFSYNPLIANPDYLILGPYNKKHDLYDQLVINRSFDLIAEFPGYQIYKRVR
jgi:hypothetical protein